MRGISIRTGGAPLEGGGAGDSFGADTRRPPCRDRLLRYQPAWPSFRPSAHLAADCPGTPAAAESHFAVGEAASNAVEHAVCGTARDVQLEVTRGRPTPV
jgi:hypothetical protein